MGGDKCRKTRDLYGVENLKRRKRRINGVATLKAAVGW